MNQETEAKTLAQSVAIPLSQDAVILLALATAHLWFSPINSSLIVLMMALYVIVGLICPEMPDEVEKPSRKHSAMLLARLAILLFVILMATIVPTAWNVILRHADGPETHAHDGLVQVEAAVEFLLVGKNPYAEDYLSTPLNDWRANVTDVPFRGPLYHFVYLPFILILSVPPYLLFHSLIGWYDQRFLYMLCFLGALFLVPLMVKKQRDRLVLLVLLGLNFLFANFISDGRNDILILFGLMLTTVMLSRQRLSSASVVMGLTMAVKHQTWFFFPFFMLYTMPRPLSKSNVVRWLLSLWPMYLSVSITILPFLLWDPMAFLEDTILYVMGRGEYSFPIFGIGLSRLLLPLGVVPSEEAQFPFIWFSLALSLPALFYAVRRQWNQNTLSNMWFGFAVFSFAFQFPSRFFNDNYLIFCLQALFIALYVMPAQWKHIPRAHTQ